MFLTITILEAGSDRVDWSAYCGSAVAALVWSVEAGRGFSIPSLPATPELILDMKTSRAG